MSSADLWAWAGRGSERGVADRWVQGGTWPREGRDAAAAALRRQVGTPVRGRVRTRAEREGAGSGARMLLSGPALSEGGGEAHSAETLG